MINNLRFRFVIISTLSMAIVFVLVISGINLIRYDRMLRTIDGRLETIASRNSEMISGTWLEQITGTDMQTIVASRYFSVSIDPQGDIKIADIKDLYPLDEDTVTGFVSGILLGSRSGFVRDYRYLVVKSGSGTKVFFYDCSEALHEFRSWRDTSILIADSALLLAFVVIELLSEQIVKPVSRRYEEHKSFIADAGHEIKTPLAIIGADTALLEDALGEESEWGDDIRLQIKNLTELTDSLVLLSEIEERHKRSEKQDSDLTAIIKEAFISFRSRAIAEDKRYDCRLEEDIRIDTDGSLIRRIMSILLDNAMKYSDKEVEVILKRCEKDVSIVVRNDNASEVSGNDILHMFDRFYRADISRSEGKSGHGLGLSIARAACDNIGGRITARKDGEDHICLEVTIPVR